MTTNSMEFSRRGRWWIPGIERELTGVWRCEEDSGVSELEIDGPLTDTEYQELTWPIGEDVPVILGRTVDGKEVTLCDVHLSVRSSYGPNGVDRTVSGWTPFAFDGAQLATGRESPLVQVAVELGNLAAWMNPPEPLFNDSTDDDGVRHFTYDFAIPPSMSVETDFATLEFRYGFRGQRDDLGHHMQSPSVVRVEPRTPATYQEIVERAVWPIQHFIALATDSPSRFAWVQALAEEHWVRADDGFEPIEWRHALEVVEPARGRHRGKEVDPVSMVFGASWIDDPGAAVSKWFELWETYRDALVLLLSHADLQVAEALQLQFLQVIQGLEVLHRIRSGDERMWFVNRLSELLELAGPQIATLLRADFAELAKDTRNHYTHWSKPERAAQNEDLYWLTEEAHVLATAVLLRDLGLDGERSSDLIVKSRRGSRLVNRRRFLASQASPGLPV